MNPGAAALRRTDAGEIKLSLPDPLAFASSLNLEVSKNRKQSGDGIFVLCPGGHDRTASLSLRPMRDGIAAHCFGCGLNGSVLDVIAAVRGLDIRRDFRRVIEEGLALAGLPPLGASTPRTGPSLRSVRSVPSEAPPELAVDVFGELAAEILERCPLAAAADVQRYLADRGVLEAASADGWGALPSPAEQGPIAAEILECFGPLVLARSKVFRLERGSSELLIRNGAPAFIWTDHRIVIPWRAFGVDGAIVALQRRQLGSTAEGPKYALAGRPVAPYVSPAALENVTDATSIAYVEGAIDALSLGEIDRADGTDRLAIGVPGLGAWDPAWAKLARGRRAFIATDDDPPKPNGKPGAGNNPGLISKWRDDLLAASALEVRRLQPTSAPDWNAVLTRRRAKQ